MRLIVIIPTLGRKDLVTRTLEHLEKQVRPPDEVIITAPDESHVQPYQAKAFEVSWVFGKKGLCAQRNQALEHALGRSDVITFFDDDFLPANSYLHRLVDAFQANPDWVVIRGEAVYDGASGPGFTFDEGLKLLRFADNDDAASSPRTPLIADHVGGYGCNMSVRSDAIGDIRFDERLPLYGWQEDIDFTYQLRTKGRVVGMNTLYGVHLGMKKGRVRGVQFGYSQVANAFYLVRKGTVPAAFAYKLMLRNITANVIKSIWPEAYIDRRGRLKGNLLAAYHVVRGKIEPEYILRL